MDEAVKDYIEKLARRIIELHLEAPVMFFLELHRPLRNIAANGILLLEPLAWPFTGFDGLKSLKASLASDEGIDLLISLLSASSDSTIQVSGEHQ